MTSVVGYRLSGKKSIGRKKGNSAVGYAAYISRERLKDSELNKIFDYRYGHSESIFSKLMLPYGSPRWATDREVFWNAVERNENRLNSQFARVWELSLPYQLTEEQMIATVQNFVKDNFTEYGIPVDMALHAPNKNGSDKNYHAHLLQCLRRIDKSGFVGNKLREWKDIELLKIRRENWAIECSEALKTAGFNEESQRWRYGHLTLIDQTEKANARGDYQYASACNHTPNSYNGVAIGTVEKRRLHHKLENENVSNIALQQNQINQNENEILIDYEGQNNWYNNLSNRLNELKSDNITENIQEINTNLLTEEIYKKFKDILPRNKKIGDELTQSEMQFLKQYEENMNSSHLENDHYNSID